MRRSRRRRREREVTLTGSGAADVTILKDRTKKTIEEFAWVGGWNWGTK